MSVSRTVDIDYLTPAELAHLFTKGDGYHQAQFFSEVWKITKDWPGAGWCMQSLDICEKADSDARSAITTLAAHLEPSA